VQQQQNQTWMKIFGPRIHASRYRVKYYSHLCKKRYITAIKTRCGSSSMGRL